MERERFDAPGRNYQKRMFRGALCMQVMVVVFSLIMVFFTTLTVIMDQAVDSAKSQLVSMNRYAELYRTDVQEQLKNLAGASYWSALVKSFNSASSGAEQSEAVREMKSRLTEAGFSNSRWTGLCIITRNGVITDMSAYPYDIGRRMASSGPTGDYALARTVYNNILKRSYKIYSARNVLIGRISDEAMLAAVLEYDALLPSSADGRDGLFIMDAGDNLVYVSPDSPASAYVCGAADDFFLRDGFGVNPSGTACLASVWFAEEGAYLDVEYIDPETGMRWLRLLDVTDMALSLMPPLSGAALLAVAVMLAALRLCSRLSRWALEPFRDLLRIAEASRDTFEATYVLMLNRLRHERSLRTRAFALFCVTLLPLPAMLPAATGSMKEAVFEQVLTSYVQTVSQNAQSVALRLGQYRQRGSRLAFSSELRRLLTNAPDRARFLDILLSERAFSSGIRSASLYDADGNILFSTADGSATATDEPAPLDARYIAAAREKYSYVKLEMDSRNPDDFSMIYALRAVTPSESESLFSVIGYLALDMDDPLSGTLDVLEAQYDGSWYLYDDSRWSLIGTKEYLPLRSVVEGMAQGGMIDLSAEHAYRQFTAETGDAEDMLLVSCKIAQSDWTLIRMTTLEPIRRISRILPLTMSVLACALMLGMLGMAFWFATRATRVMRVTESYFESATSDRDELPAVLQPINEITILAHAFRESLMRIRKLSESVEEQRRREAELLNRRRQAEVIALQSQMDSHLISNIFASMKLLLFDGDLELLARVIDATGNFLRSGLIHSEFDVPLSREIAHVNAYLEIQQIRFGERLHVCFAPVDPALLKCVVPKYILQPVLENAIRHGMPPKRVLSVNIEITRDGGFMRILVEDDGVGMGEAEARALNERLQAGGAAEHIGLSNVHERLALRYGGDGTLALESRPGGPTRVAMRMPAQATEPASREK